MKKTNIGILLGLSTYILWGFLSLFWKLLSGVNSYNTFSYRIVFTVLTMLLYMLISGNKARYKNELGQLISRKKDLFQMTMASVLISLNWLVYIYAVSHNQATQASLGYYIMPLISILLSIVFLHEHLCVGMIFTILLAATGVVVLILNTGHLPLVSLVLAFSFGLYGLIKKNISLSSDVAMLVESGIIFPFALIYLIFFSNESMLDYSLMENVLLIISGVVTAIPLLLFTEAVKRAPLNIIGFIQYINPTIQLIIAVLIFKEAVTMGELKGFIFIWLAIGVFVLAQIVEMRKTHS